MLLIGEYRIDTFGVDLYIVTPYSCLRYVCLLYLHTNRHFMTHLKTVLLQVLELHTFVHITIFHAVIYLCVDMHMTGGAYGTVLAVYRGYPTPYESSDSVNR